MKKYLMAIALLAAIAGGISPAAATTIYNINLNFWFNFAMYSETDIGSITTDGATGAITPANILNFNLTAQSFAGGFLNQRVPISRTSSSDAGDTFTWTPGSLIATDTSLSFNLRAVSDSPPTLHVGFFSILAQACYALPACDHGPLGSIQGMTGRTYISFNPVELASGGHLVEVPGPVIGAGLPGIIGGLLAMWLAARRKASAANDNATLDEEIARLNRKLAFLP